MSLVNQGTLKTLAEAAAAPEDYVSGSERSKLRAAFDLACSQITNRTLGFQSRNRMMLRAKLNSLTADKIPQQYRQLIAALKKALKAAEPLYSSKAYIDDEEEDVVQMRNFVRDGLKPLLIELENIPQNDL
ncbi:MAG TPA: hypothetical protein VE031_00485 [Chthoniobacterales bacterium]|nr:hypothetical protein [Chthoniobacterales bacterium]